MTPVPMELEKEVADLRERVQRLEHTVASAGSDERVREPWEANLPPWIQLVDGRTLKPLMERVLREMGIDPSPPGITAQELRERMIREGVNRDERVGNTILEEMRRERA